MEMGGTMERFPEDRMGGLESGGVGNPEPEHEDKEVLIYGGKCGPHSRKTLEGAARLLNALSIMGGFIVAECQKRVKNLDVDMLAN